MSSDWPGNAAIERTTFGRLFRGELMARVPSKGNRTTERAFATLLRSSRITGWRRHQPLPGRPDFAWKTKKVLVFVDGCFWHGHSCRNTTPKVNAKAWRNKIGNNKKRDLRNNRFLRKRGWRVIRIWECQLSRNPERCLMLLRKALSVDETSK
jgi:DNA mismatch endonuclease, patch repair protein